jgi:isoquinoline 1-oxidoreductase beta subunit
MLVAEELDVPLARIALVDAGAEAIYGNVAALVGSLPLQPRDAEPGQETRAVRLGRWFVAKLGRELGLSITGGSSSVADAWEPLRLAAATARAQLLGAASLAWKLPVDELMVADGVVSHAGSGQRAHYGELARHAAATPPGTVLPKTREQWRLIGSAAPRIDLPAKVDGTARFGLDVREPGMVWAVVRHCPMLGGSTGTVDVGPAMRLPGVERVVRLGPYAGSTPALAVVGRSTWHAQRGAAALAVDWRPPPAGTLDSVRILDELAAAAREAAASNGGVAFHAEGEPDAALARATQRVESLYRAPYLAHAAMEPISCTARVADGRVGLWAATQVPSFARAMAARVAGVPEANVDLHVTYLGGGFGRRLETDMIGQAVRVALETAGRPVQLVWPDRKSTRLNSSHNPASRMPSSA